MRRSRAIRLSLLPLLASAALAKAQSWPGEACRQDDPDCPAAADDSSYQDPNQDQGQDQDQSTAWPYSTYSSPVYVTVPYYQGVPRGGFGSYFIVGVGG